MSIDEQKERLMATLTEVGGQLRVRGALTPILWLCGIIAVPSICTLSWSEKPPAIISWVLIAVVGTALFGFLWLLFFDRDRLQSEEYQIKTRTLDLIEEKGSRKAIDAATVRAITESEFLQLPEPRQGDQQ